MISWQYKPYRSPLVVDKDECEELPTMDEYLSNTER